MLKIGIVKVIFSNVVFVEIFSEVVGGGFWFFVVNDVDECVIVLCIVDLICLSYNVVGGDFCDFWL